MSPPARGHELIEHTADVGLRVWAPTLDDLFAEAALALVAVMGTAHGGTVRREDVALESPDRDALFVDWLSEVLFLFDARGLVPVDARVHVGHDPWSLRAAIDGADAAHFVQHGPAVKAVTFHGLEILDSEEGVEVRVYLDV